MKSIKQQYIDLKEGRMSQANFMRNLRMTFPNLVTNVISFNDSVKILRNKGILSEAEIKENIFGTEPKEEETEYTSPEEPEYDENAIMAAIKDYEEEEAGKYTTGGEQFPISEAKSKWENTSGKAMYDQFKEIDNLNGQEVLIGIDAEMEKNHELTKKEAAKIVIKNLKKNPLYYTAEYMSGVEGYEPEYISPSTKPETQNMTPVKGENFVDKANEMKPVKGIEKPKKDSDAATAQKYKTSGISLMSLVAKTVRGVKKMDATGEKMKKVAIKEEFRPGVDFGGALSKMTNSSPSSPKWNIMTGEMWDNMSHNEKVNALKNNRFIGDRSEEWYNKAANYSFDQLVTKGSPERAELNIPPFASLLQGFNFPMKEKKSAEDRLAEQISQYIKETFDGRDNMTDVAGHQLDEVKVGDKLKHKLTGAELEITKVDGNNITTKYTKLGGMEGKAKLGDINKTNANLIGKTYELI